jgi:hypothetical protein
MAVRPSTRPLILKAVPEADASHKVLPDLGK